MLKIHGHMTGRILQDVLFLNEYREMEAQEVNNNICLRQKLVFYHHQRLKDNMLGSASSKQKDYHQEMQLDPVKGYSSTVKLVLFLLCMLSLLWEQHQYMAWKNFGETMARLYS